MQITLIQSEIEQALKNYINDIMSVKDGMEIEIQLKATRGEEGTTAIIDIVPQKPKASRGGRTSGEIPAKVEPAKAEVAQAVAEAAPEPVAESVAEAEADDAEQVAEQAQEAEALEPAPVEAEQAPAEEAPRKSLFAGLSKPQN